MSFQLWTSEDVAIDLGDPFDLLRDFATLEQKAGDEYPELMAVPNTNEETLDPEYVAAITEQASAALEKLDLNDGERWVLGQIAGINNPPFDVDGKRFVGTVTKFNPEHDPHSGEFAAGGRGGGGGSENEPSAAANMAKPFSESANVLAGESLDENRYRQYKEEIDAQMKGVTLALLGVAARLQEYPIFVVRVHAVSGLTLDGEPAVRGTGSGIVGVYYDDSISVAAARFSRATDKLTLGASRWNVDESVTGLIRHELGHHIYRHASAQIKTAWGGAWDTHMAGIKQSLAGYAGTNEKEAFAEAFCAFTHPDAMSGKKKLAPWITKFMKEYLG